MGLTSIPPASTFIHALRKADFKGKLIAGGHGATMQPFPILKSGADAVVCGEGEVTFRKVVIYGISLNVKGLALLLEGNVLKTPYRPLIENLDTLKEPSRDLIKSSLNNTEIMETSRGCPHKCNFCEATQFYYNKWRGRSPKIVARDVVKLVRNNVHIIHIADDNFTANPKRALRICKILLSGPLPLFFFFSARTDDLLKLPNLISYLAKARFLRAGVGIETLEPELTASIQKPISLSQHQKACAMMRKEGIFTLASFIIGLPGETKTMRERAVELAVKVGVDSAQFVPFQPLPGTRMENVSIESELINIKSAAEATKNFKRHPVVIANLLQASKNFTIRGKLARVSLNHIIQEGILKSSDSDLIVRTLNQIEPDIYS